jgi:Fur family ferric uptake transcriptional regulator
MRPSLNSDRNDKPSEQLLQDFLDRKGIKITRGRRLIFEEAMNQMGHFVAEELYIGLRRKRRPVSRATVYRALDLLVEGGFLERISFDREGSRYERILGRPRHGHLYCLECGQIFDFIYDGLDRLPEEVYRELNFKVTYPELKVSGYCQGCQAAGHPSLAERDGKSMLVSLTQESPGPLEWSGG